MAFSKRHYRLVSPPADTADAIAYRRRHAAAVTQARIDMAARYAELTAENAQEAIDYQEQRINELLRG